MYSRSRIVPGHRLEQLGQVAADPALDVDGHHDPGEVLAVEALGHACQGGLEADAEARLDQHAAELRRDRLRALVDDGVDGLGEGQARRQGARHQLQGVGQAAAEGLAPPAESDAEPHPRQHGTDEQEQQPIISLPAADDGADEARRQGDPVCAGATPRR
jgi:hypothetical protein